MKQRCIQLIGQKLGRDLTKGEERTIEQRIRDAMVSEARKDPAAWQAMPAAAQLKAAAAVAAKDYAAEAKLKAERIQKAIEADDRIANYTAEQVNIGADATKLDALVRMVVPTYDRKSNITSVESNANGIFGFHMGQLAEALETISPRWFGILADRKAESLMQRALHGERTGNAEIDGAAKVITEQLNALRERMNAAGGNIGKLDNYGHPHSWSRRLFVEMGQDKVANLLFDRVDRSRYVHEDGRLYSDDEMREFLRNAWLTVTTNGANKRLAAGPAERKSPGGAIKGNRGSEQRQIHFRDGAAAAEALAQLSDKNLFQSIIGHIQGMARDISLIEAFGSNSDHMLGKWIDQLTDEAIVSGVPEQKARAKAFEIAQFYNYLAGNGNPPIQREWLAATAQGLRNLALLKLGFSPITSITDFNTMAVSAYALNVSRLGVVRNTLAALNPANPVEKRMAQRMGLMAASMKNDMERLAFDGKSTSDYQSPTARKFVDGTATLGSVFMKATFMESFDNAKRRAFSLTMSDTIGHLTRETSDIRGLAEGDYQTLLAKGIDQATWDIWRQADVESMGGNETLLTPDGIMAVQGVPELAKQKAATKLMAVLLEEQGVAIIAPGAEVRAPVAAQQRGTFTGELVRSAYTFKSFVTAYYNTHFTRAIKGYDAGGTAAYAGALFIGGLITGMITTWVKDVLGGRDPRNMNPLDPDNKHGMQNLMSAMLQGGALGAYGDFIFSTSTRYGASPIEQITGPTVGMLAQLDRVTRQNLIQMANGENTNFGAEAIQFGKQFLPTNLWYTKAALDRIIFDQMQEMASPGYLSSIRSKAAQQGQTYFWKPGQPVPERAPDLAKGIGAAP